MELRIERNILKSDRTIGKLFVDGVPFCDTLEDADRFLETDPNAKVYGESAIPRGHYKVVLSYSPRLGYMTPEILGINGFEGVRIHAGNSPKDTLGCPLVGRLDETSLNLKYGSREVFNDLMVLLACLNRHGIPLWLTVV